MLVVGSAIGMLLASCGGGSSAAPSSAVVSAVPTASPVYDDPDHLEVGECFDPIEDRDGQALLAAAVRGCETTHLAELIGTHELPDPVGAPWPGESAVAEASEAACRAAFKDYVGIEFDQSRLQASFYTPVEESWSYDRTVLCTVDALPLAPFTSSVKESRQ